MTNLTPLMSSANPNWETPENVLSLVRELYGGQIGLDPCSSPSNPTGAALHLSSGGLDRPWSNFGREVFCNPPYGRGIHPWVSAMATEGAKDGMQIVGLLPARTDTKWWELVTTATAVCFWRGRLKFKGAPSSAPFPSATPYWGDRLEDFLRIFEPHGWCVGSAR